MEQSEILSEIIKLKNLKQYENSTLSDDEFFRMAKINILVRDFKANPLFYYETDVEDKVTGKKNREQSKKSKVDQKLAEEKFKAYLQKYEFENESDLDTLRSLIFNEVYEQRIQRQINGIIAEDKDGLPNKNLTEQLTEVQNQKLELKVKLGIDKEESGDRELNVLQKLQVRFDKHIEENREEFSIACGCCGEMLLLRRRVKDFDSMKHGWFSGRFFFNLPLIKLVKNGTLTKEQATEVLMGAGMGGDTQTKQQDYSNDYIEWCLKNLGEILKQLEK